MKSIKLSVSELHRMVSEMSDHGMDIVKVAIIAETVDEDEFFPAFLHFEAYTKGGNIKDYESIDIIDSVPLRLHPVYESVSR